MADANSSRSFDKKLYMREALDEAVTAFGDFAEMAVDRSGDAWTVGFSGIDPDFEPEELASEFANYVLAGTIQRKR